MHRSDLWTTTGADIYRPNPQTSNSEVVSTGPLIPYGDLTPITIDQDGTLWLAKRLPDRYGNFPTFLIAVDIPSGTVLRGINAEVTSIICDTKNNSIFALVEYARLYRFDLDSGHAWYYQDVNGNGSLICQTSRCNRSFG